MQHTYFVLPFYDHKRRYQSRRCGDDSHPGEEIYAPPGDEASHWSKRGEVQLTCTGHPQCYLSDEQKYTGKGTT